ncbi:hypothetical protein ACFY7H_22290 [Streptomyces sp. NPDC012794]
MEEWEAKLASYGTDSMSMVAADIQRRVAVELSWRSSSSTLPGCGRWLPR